MTWDPGMPSFTHETWMLSTAPASMIRAIACILRFSAVVAPARAFPAR